MLVPCKPSAPHLTTKVQEYFNVKNTKSAINQHIQKRSYCSNVVNRDLLFSLFRVIKKCKSEYNTKIEEALLIKKENSLF